MAGRRGENRIRGPQSALTDFLAANNISAQQIRDTHAQRVARRAAEAGETEDTVVAETVTVTIEEEVEAASAGEGPSASRRRARDSKKMKQKAKEKKRKRKKGKGSDDDFEISDDEGLGRQMYQKAVPMPGQLENCELCNKRFTVTAYSKNGPEGGLLCTPCGKQQKTADKAAQKKTQKGGQGRKRRQVESNRLDGLVRLGTKSLADLCIEQVAKHHTEVEEFGDLPNSVLERLSQIFSKKRVLDPGTLPLFLQPALDNISIFDAAKLEENDFKQIFAMVPRVGKLVLRNAGQFKDGVIDYMMEKTDRLRHFQVYGANLVTNDKWIEFFTTCGASLEAVMIEWCDAAFDDNVVAAIAAHCPNLSRLKLKYCRKLTSDCIRAVQQMPKLQHLSLKLRDTVAPEDIAALIESHGKQLRTFSLEGIAGLNDDVVAAIRARCSSLSKLRLSEMASDVSDAALAALFDPTVSVLPPLSFLDLSSARDEDYTQPSGPEENPVGVAAAAFTALMHHSGNSLRHLDVASCRHISHAAFCEAFSPASSRVYPQLETVNITFCSSVDASVVRGIFATCPAIKKVIAFGCFSILEEIVVPSGVAVIGVPRAQDAIEKVGEAGVNVQQALTFMDALAAQ